MASSNLQHPSADRVSIGSDENDPTRAESLTIFAGGTAITVGVGSGVGTWRGSWIGLAQALNNRTEYELVLGVGDTSAYLMARDGVLDVKLGSHGRPFWHDTTVSGVRFGPDCIAQLATLDIR